MPKSKFIRTFPIQPLQHLLSTEQASPNQGPDFAGWPSMNAAITQKSIMSRPGYEADRTIGSTVADSLVQEVQRVAVFVERDETKNTLYLSKTDLMLKETATGKTYSFLTPRYTTGTATINTAKTIVTGTDTVWSSANVTVGDQFIFDTHHTTDVEPDAQWATISAVTDETHITLSPAYTGAVVTGGTYKIRQLYSVPAGDRWNYTIAGGKFVFTNGNENVQYWNGTDAVASLDSTNAVKARYCIGYAQRLVLADMYVSATRQPWRIKFSAVDSTTDWTTAASGAGEADLVETEYPIMGLGIVGQSMVVYKRESIIMANRTGVVTNPIAFNKEQRGVGKVGPYSNVPVLGTEMFLGAENFYMINGDRPEAIGDKIWAKFKDIVPVGERENVWGYHSKNQNKVIWMANTTTEGQLGFAFDYINNEWMTFKFRDYITGAGEGAS